MPTLLPQLARLCSAAPRTDAELLEQFLNYRDEAAFAALVCRHGPMVMGVCRRLLRHHSDAEDAFQATFLVLVRKAFSLTGHASLAPWLHGVAQRTALKARTLATKRAAWLEPLDTEPVDHAHADPDAWEWKCLLEEEVRRLPDKYRQPVVLCYMAGQSKQMAAERLGLPEGTVSSRLARARETLHRRLSQRGVALTSASVAALLVPCAVSARLLQTTTTAGVDAAHGLPPAVSATVLKLSQGGMGAVVLTSYRRLGVAVFLLTLCGLICGWSGQPSSVAAEPARQAAAPPMEAQGRIEGRVTAADTGKPVAGVMVKVRVPGMPFEFPPRMPSELPAITAQTNAEGRYAMTVPMGYASFGEVIAPVGYYPPQVDKTWSSVVTTAAQPTVTRDIVVYPGLPWQVRLEGLKISPNDRPLFHASVSPRMQPKLSTNHSATADDHGGAILSLPPAGDRCNFHCRLGKVDTQYEGERWIRVEYDRGFDPRQVVGDSEPLPEGKSVRLKDTAGRTAVVERGAVSVEKGQVVLRFIVKPATDLVVFTLRGRVVDESGAPLANAQATLLSESGGPMPGFETRTDVQGQFALTVRMRPSAIPAKWQLKMLILKPGFGAAFSSELPEVQVRKTGSGDLGTVTLPKGHIMRGKVVDENGQPLHGALVRNFTGRALSLHLYARTDAAGRFNMPGVAWGSQQMGVAWGDPSAMRGAEVEFDAQHQDVTLTWRPPAKKVPPQPVEE